jgi:hypothetical protein
MEGDDLLRGLRCTIQRFLRGVNSYYDELFALESILDVVEQQEYASRLPHVADLFRADLVRLFGQNELPDNLWQSLHQLVVSYDRFTDLGSKAMRSMVLGARTAQEAQNVQDFLDEAARLPLQQSLSVLHNDVKSVFDNAVEYVRSLV